MLASIGDRILGLHGWMAAAVVFSLPALESSAFIGFVFPGEIAVLLGGVLAYQHQLSLPLALAAAIAGAILGDSIGYEVGKRYGRQLLNGTVGRVVPKEHLDRAEVYLAERGGKAVFFGRFTAALRVLVPGLAGMAGLRYRTFVVYNAAGGILWASGFVLAGYLAGSSWRHVEQVAGRASLVLLLLVALVAVVGLGARWVARHPERVHQLAARQLDRPAIARLRRRYDRQLAFVGRRLRPGQARGLSLTGGFAVLALAGWAFGAVTQDVVAGDEAARLDRPVLDWFVAHRETWLDDVLNAVTDLGSSAIVVPVALGVGMALWRRRDSLQPLLFLAATYAGAELLLQAIKHLTTRPRPPAGLAVAHLSGYAFPSGHATLAVAMWGAIAVVAVPASSSWRLRVIAGAGVITLALVIGATRLYLGAHWLTDVLAGWALGATWLTIVHLAMRPSNPRTHPRAVADGEVAAG